MKKLAAILATLMTLFPVFAFAAIAQDVSDYNTTTASSLTFSHTNTGSNLYYVVGFLIDGSGDLATGVTYNGVAMTRLSTVIRICGLYDVYLYGLAGPATGAHNTVISLSSSQLIQAYSVSYTGVSQTGNPTASSSAIATATSIASTLTSTADNSIHVVNFRVCSDTVGYAVSNATRVNGPGTSEGIWQSNPLLITPAGSHTMTQSVTNSQAMGQTGFILSPVAVPAKIGSLPMAHAFWWGL